MERLITKAEIQRHLHAHTSVKKNKHEVSMTDTLLEKSSLDHTLET